LHSCEANREVLVRGRIAPQEDRPVSLDYGVIAERGIDGRRSGSGRSEQAGLDQ
jgi:hypothetical protein